MVHYNLTNAEYLLTYRSFSYAVEMRSLLLGHNERRVSPGRPWASDG